MFANQRDIRCLLGSLGDKHPDMPAAAGNAVPPDRHADDRIHYVIIRRFHSRGKILQLPLSNGAARLFWKLERRDAVATDACNNVSRSSSLDSNVATNCPVRIRPSCLPQRSIAPTDECLLKSCGDAIASNASIYQHERVAEARFDRSIVSGISWDEEGGGEEIYICRYP